MIKRRAMLIIALAIFGALFWKIAQDAADHLGTIQMQPAPVAQKPTALPAEKANLIRVDAPLPESALSASPITITGVARGNWFFEATAPVEVVNWDGLIIGEGYIKVNDGSDWMTTDYVPFTGTISYDSTQLGPYKYGWIILKKSNASGELRFDDSLEYKVLFP